MRQFSLPPPRELSAGEKAWMSGCTVLCLGARRAQHPCSYVVETPLGVQQNRWHLVSSVSQSAKLVPDQPVPVHPVPVPLIAAGGKSESLLKPGPSQSKGSFSSTYKVWALSGDPQKTQTCKCVCNCQVIVFKLLNKGLRYPSDISVFTQCIYIVID